MDSVNRVKLGPTIVDDGWAGVLHAASYAALNEFTSTAPSTCGEATSNRESDSSDVEKFGAALVNDVTFVGTGKTGVNADSYFGVGINSSSDSGTTFSLDATNATSREAPGLVINPEDETGRRFTMRNQVWLAGFPSFYGGADTELDHLIDLLRCFDVDVRLVPMFGADSRMKANVISRGCRIHEYADKIFAGKTVISMCNSSFLEKLPLIIRSGRPDKVIWFNCMTSLFDLEKEAHRNGWIDLFGFESEYQKSILIPQLNQIRPIRTFSYRPFFNAARIEWRYRRWDGCYKIGRISRDDAAKFAADTWQIFDRILVPPHLKKKVYILGYGPNAKERTGPPPATLDWQTWSPNGIPASRFYNTIDTMIHKTGGSRENCPRVLLEAFAHGVVPVVEQDFSFPEFVAHGETGFMGASSDEMSYYASMLAMNPREHRRIAENGRSYLEENFFCPEECWSPWNEILNQDFSGEAVSPTNGASEITRGRARAEARLA